MATSWSSSSTRTAGRSPSRIGLRTLDPSSEDVTTYITAATGGAGAAVAFEVSGAAGGVTTAVDVLAVRGRLVMVAIHSQPREINLHRFFWRELTMVGARLYDRSDFETAVVPGGRRRDRRPTP